MTATQQQIDGLKAANQSLDRALRNCRRAVRGEAPITESANNLGDILAGAFGRTMFG